ncbi:hypothetical protein P4132_29360 [Pseudomonas aeruginosa]|nr:hypothetical protein [Pseudomonas aeruginosa]
MVSAKEAAEIRTGSLNNSQKGVTARAARRAWRWSRTWWTTARTAASIAKGAIDANLKGLDQQGSGRLVSDTAIALDLRGGELVNRAYGLIATPGTLLLRQPGVVDNSSGGEISSDRSFTVAVTALSCCSRWPCDPAATPGPPAHRPGTGQQPAGRLFPSAEGWMSLHSSSTTIAASLVARATHASGKNCPGERDRPRGLGEGARDLIAKQVSSASGRIAG